MSNKRKITPYPLYNSDNPLLSENKDSLHLFLGKPFWIWDQDKHDEAFTRTAGNCCFNHIIGLPTKNAIEHPLYDYEKEIQEAVENNQHVWIKKARGIGATEFMIRYLSYLALATDRLVDKSIFIIAGTREEFANEIKERMERLFTEYHDVIRDSKYTQTFVNKTKFKVFPTKNLKDVRGYVDVAYLFIDEADYFNPKEQNEIKYVIKSYEEKSKGKIILVSTAGESNGLFEQIENDPNSDFYKVFMLVNKGRGKIFNDKFLEEQKLKDPAFFSREYEGRYGYGLGNVFLHEEIEKCLTQAAANVNHSCDKSMGIDPGFGSSKFGVTILQLEDNILKVIFSKEYDRPSYENMIDYIVRLKVQFKPVMIYVDAAKPDFIKSLKSKFNETQDYDKIIERAGHDKIDYEYRMYVIPVSFNEWGKELLGRFQQFVSKGWFSLSSVEHRDLVTQMRMAKYKENGNLDKEEASVNTYDVFDSARLALKMFEIN